MSFLALLQRVKYIKRWSLMRTTAKENVAEHSFEVASIAHILAVMAKQNGVDVNPFEVATAALYHDVSEVLTSDLPTPVKYINARLSNAFKELESAAETALVSTLPAALQEPFQPLILSEKRNPVISRYIKAADTISAYLKAKSEVDNGNTDFVDALAGLEAKLDSIQLPEVAQFRSAFFAGYSMSLDDLLNNCKSGMGQA